MLEEGLAFERAGQTDSALAAYEKLSTLGTNMWEEATKDFSLPLAYQRLGELYEGKGEKDKAIGHYGTFVELWRGADPELQPRVKEVQRRIGDLAGERP